MPWYLRFSLIIPSHNWFLIFWKGIFTRKLIKTKTNIPWLKRHTRQRQMSSDPERARETSHPLCARRMWSPADPSLCPRGRCNVSMRCGLQRSNGNNNTYQDMSPLDVRIWLSLRNLQQLRYPVCPGNSRLTRTAPSRFFKLNKKIVSEVSTCIPETLTCRLSRCYPDRRKRRSCPRERRRRSWPRRTSGEWRAPCW